MIKNNCPIRFSTFLILFCITFHVFLAAQPCPKLNNNATLTGDCKPGITPCTVCPGDMITLNATGTGLQPGVCVNWYYGTTNTFNPYSGQGTLMGCAQIAPATPNPCGSCPTTLAIYVDACGTEANNEIIALLSGSGFYVDDLEITFDASTSSGGGNASIGAGCSWQEPSGNAISSIQSICPNATVVGAGPGEAVPPNVPVIIFTSAGYDYNYNFGSLCPLSPVIYVMQNACERTEDAFTNGPGSGQVSTTVSLTCGCSDNTTYNIGSLVGGNGAFVTDAGFFPFYGNAGCGFPNLPGGGGGGGANAIQIPPFTYTITPDMCNGGPFYAVGVVQPLPAGCMESMATTNYIPFNVPCPMPMLQPGPSLCASADPFDLNLLADPAVPNGVWSGPGVTGASFDPDGLFGVQTVQFMPTGPCAQPGSTDITIATAPAADFNNVPAVCSGQNVALIASLLGQAPFEFDLYAGSTQLGAYTSVDPVFAFPPQNPQSTTTYSIQNFRDANCEGPDEAVTVVVTSGFTANLTLSGPGAICAGQNTYFTVDFNGGTAPWTFTPQINGVNQSPITTASDPYEFSLTLPNPGNITVTLGSVSDPNCNGTPSGAPTVQVSNTPTANLLPGLKNLCAGQPDTLFVNTSAAGLNLTWSLNGVPQAPVMTTAPQTIIPVVPSLGQNIYALVDLTGAACAGLVSGRDTALVNPVPVATFSGDTSVCNGGTAVLRVLFNSGSPATFTYTANGLPQSPITAPFSPHSFFLNPSVSTHYVLTSITQNGCTATLNDSVFVAVNQAPTAILSGNLELCVNGGGDSITVVFGGIGPTYTFNYTANGILQPPVVTNQTTYKIFVNPGGYVKYEPVSVSNGSCTGTVSGEAEAFVFVPSSASLAGSPSFCDSAHTTLPINLTGTQPFIITYAINGVAQPADTTDESPYLIPVDIYQTTVYSLVSIQSPGCTGIVNGTATVTINRAPAYTNVQPICNAAAGTYIIQFTAINAALPLTVVSGGGSFSGNTYTSPPIPLANGYSVTFRDANNCGDVIVAGPSTCNCSTQSGTMNLSPLTPCAGNTATAIHNGNQVNDGSDTLLFILHTNPALPVGAILAWNNTPTFSFGAGIQTGITYYISAVSGNPNGVGQVDLNDPCTAVSQGTPVTWQPLPTATLSADQDLCAGVDGALNISFTGVPPFNFSYTVNGVATTASTVGASYGINVNLQQTATYILTAVSDAACPGVATDTAVVTVHTVPQIDTAIVNCEPDKLNFSVSLTLQGGDPATYVFSGNSGAFNAGNQQFTTNLIPAGDPYLIRVTDQWGCGIDSISGIGDCNCNTNAGSLSAAPIDICNGQFATIPASTGVVLEPDDVLVYLLCTTANPALGQVLAVNTSPTFGFLPNMTVGTTYYIVAAAANGSGNNISFSDNCLDYSNATPVRWRAAISAQLNGATAICPGETATLTVQLTGGTGNYTFNYLANNVPQSVTSSANILTLNVSPTVSTNYLATGVSDAGCPGTASGFANVLVQPVPQIENLQTICNPDGVTYQIVFAVNNGPANNTGYTVSGITGGLNDSTFTSVNVLHDTPYNITVSTSAGCSSTASGTVVCPCLSAVGTLSGILTEACIDDTLSVSLNNQGLNLDSNDTLLYVLCTDPLTLPTGILSVSSHPRFAYQNSYSTSPVTYYIVAVAGNISGAAIDWTDACTAVSNAVPVQFFTPPTAAISGDTTVCVGSNVNLSVQLSGPGPYNFTYTVNGILQTPVSTSFSNYQIAISNVQQVQTIQLQTVSNQWCTVLLNDAATIDLLAQPRAIISGSGGVCPGDTAILTLTVENSSSANIQVLQNGGNPLTFNNIGGTSTIRVAPGVTTTYTIGGAVFVGQVNNCPPAFSGSATIDVAPITLNVTTSDYNGFGVTCLAAADGSIQVSAQGGDGQYTYDWNGGGSGSGFTGLVAGTFSVTVTDTHGCTTTQVIELTEPDEIAFRYVVKNPRCYGESSGTIVLTDITGGAGSYQLSIDNQLPVPVDALPFSSPEFTPDDYYLVVSDINGCTSDALATMVAPVQLVIDLGNDRTISFGDSTFINTLLNFSTIDTFVWSPEFWLSDPDKLLTWAKPYRSQVYTLQVTDTAGCVVAQEITINVSRDDRIYVPNVFNPNADDNDGLFTIFGGPEVARIRYLRVYDRWGELVFENNNFLPNDESSSWNGYWKDKRADVGVYVYVLEAEFIDGTIKIISGDVTIAK